MSCFSRFCTSKDLAIFLRTDASYEFPVTSQDGWASLSQTDGAYDYKQGFDELGGVLDTMAYFQNELRHLQPRISSLFKMTNRETAEFLTTLTIVRAIAGFVDCEGRLQTKDFDWLESAGKILKDLGYERTFSDPELYELETHTVIEAILTGTLNLD